MSATTNSTQALAESGGGEVSLLGSMRIQMRVIGALLLREILSRYGRHNIGFLWLFVEPMIFTLLIAGFWSIMRGSHFASISVLAFSVTGYSTVLLWRGMPSRCLYAVGPNSTLLYHRQIKVLDFYLTRILLEGMGATVSLVFLVCFIAGIGWMPWPVDPLQVVGGWLMLAWFGTGLALMIGPLGERSPLVEKIWAPVSYILFPLSGAIFLVDQLPPEARNILLWLPMVHGVEYMRQGYFGPVIPFHYDMGYMTLCNLLLTLFGLAQVRQVSRQVVVE